MSCTAWDDVIDDDDSDHQADVTLDDLADIMYTSGTTGLPKGIAVRHGNVAMIPNLEPEWTGNGWLHGAPMFTFAGIAFIYNPMKMGLRGFYQPKFDAGRWLGYVERERPTFTMLVPPSPSSSSRIPTSSPPTSPACSRCRSEAPRSRRARTAGSSSGSPTRRSATPTA